jgi:hypothetical protein
MAFGIRHRLVFRLSERHLVFSATVLVFWETCDGFIGSFTFILLKFVWWLFKYLCFACLCIWLFVALILLKMDAILFYRKCIEFK